MEQKGITPHINCFSVIFTYKNDENEMIKQVDKNNS